MKDIVYREKSHIVGREILFRGKCSISKEWKYGVPVINSYGCVPVMVKGVSCDDDGGIDFDFDYIDCYTVGRYIGLKDKHKKMIFEGDIIKRKVCGMDFYYSVAFEHGEFTLLQNGDKTKPFSIIHAPEWEVIGNIYDNPKMITEGNNK